MTKKVVVVGGGIIGLSIAWRAASTGSSVTVVDEKPGRGASSVAAGMLGPTSETQFGELELARLNAKAIGCWSSFAAELEEVSGFEVDYRTNGSLLVALDVSDRAVLDRMQLFRSQLDLNTQRLRSSELRALERGLSPSLSGGAYVPGDHWVDPQRVVQALLIACRSRDVKFVAETVSQFDGREKVEGVVTSTQTIGADVTIVSAGCWSGLVDPSLALPVRPVKGQTVTLRTYDEKPILSHVIRGVVRGSEIYIVPRSDGRMTLGATSEERGWDSTVTTGAIYELLRDATAIVPGIDETVFVGTDVGLRPCSPDNGPVFGWSGREGLIVASAHYRNGVLLAPMTASSAVQLIEGGEAADEWRPFDVRRFATEVV